MHEALILNETTAVHPAFREDWLRWMLEEQIPAILGTGCFYKHQLVKIMNEIESEDVTYAVQFYAESYARYDDWIRQYSEVFRKAARRKWGQQALSFTTLMAIVQ